MLIIEAIKTNNYVHLNYGNTAKLSTKYLRNRIYDNIENRWRHTGSVEHQQLKQDSWKYDHIPIPKALLQISNLSTPVKTHSSQIAMFTSRCNEKLMTNLK